MVLGRRPVIWVELHFAKLRAETAFVFENVLKIFLYMFTSSLFLKPTIQTEFLVIVFDRPENRSCGRLLFEVFKRKADYFILTTTSEKKTIALLHQE